MKFTPVICLVALLSVHASHAATVEVDRFFQGTNDAQEVVPPAQFKAIPLGQLKAGDQIAVQVNASNKVYNDITACFATESEARSYTSRSPCHGHVKSKTPFVIEARAQESGRHYLILDNSYAALIKKTVSVRTTVRKSLSDEEMSKLTSFFKGVQTQISSTFENSEFNVYVKPCGQSNAFSNNRTADITLCTELIHDMSAQQNIGALIAVLLHEYGHSLLNKWGEPGASEEDMADQFATAMLLRGGDSGRRLLQDWISYWQRQDSHAEARVQLAIGGTHSLSVQRARNIQQSMNYPEDFSRRWNKMLYRHMKREALERVIAKPAKTDDVDLATEALRTK